MNYYPNYHQIHHHRNQTIGNRHFQRHLPRYLCPKSHLDQSNHLHRNQHNLCDLRRNLQNHQYMNLRQLLLVYPHIHHRQYLSIVLVRNRNHHRRLPNHHHLNLNIQSYYFGKNCHILLGNHHEYQPNHLNLNQGSLFFLK